MLDIMEAYGSLFKLHAEISKLGEEYASKDPNAVISEEDRTKILQILSPLTSTGGGEEVTLNDYIAKHPGKPVSQVYAEWLRAEEKRRK